MRARQIKVYTDNEKNEQDFAIGACEYRWELRRYDKQMYRIAGRVFVVVGQTDKRNNKNDWNL